MLPPAPPVPSDTDFDPSTMTADDVDLEMQLDEDDIKVELSSVEINLLIYLYLLESNFSHTAFALLSESNLGATSLFRHFHPSFPTPSSVSSRGGSISKANGTSGPSKNGTGEGFGKAEGRIERGELVRRLWKGLRWEEVERHVAVNGEPYRPSCPNPFHLLIPHVCPPHLPSSSENPSLPISASLRTSPALSKRPELFPPGPEPDSRPTPRRGRRSAAAESSKAINTRERASGSNKRKTRQSSNATDSRDQTPCRSSSPKDRQEGKDKKRARQSEPGSDHESSGDKKDTGSMEVDDEIPSRTSRVANGKEKESNGKRNAPKTRLDTTSPRSKGSMKDEKGMSEDEEEEDEEVEEVEERRGAGNPIWIPDSNISMFTEHRDLVSCLAWNPKNLDVLATGSGDGTARLWDFSSEGSSSALSVTKKPFPISHKSIESNKKLVTAVDWHPDGTVLATGSQDGVGRLFTPSGQLQGIMSYGRGGIKALKFSPSGSYILTAKDDHTVCLWSLGHSYTQSLVRYFEAHAKEVNDVDWLDDDVFASGGNDHNVFVFRSNDKRPRYRFTGHTDDVTKLKWSPARPGAPPENRLLASVSDDGCCRIWRMPGYPDDRGTTSRSASPIKPRDSDGDDYFDGGGMGGGVGGARFGMDKGFCLHTLEVVTGSENSRMDTVEWSPRCTEGRMILAAGGQDATVKLFDALSGQTLHVLSGLEIGTGSIAFSPTHQNLIAAGGWNGRLVIWNVYTGKKVREYEIEEDPNRQSSREKPMMRAMAWREDGKQLVVGMQNKMVMGVFVGDIPGLH